MSWETLIDEHALGRLLPAEHRRFAAPVREALVVFLGGLPAERQAAILEQQAGLTLDATLAQRLGAIAIECPVLHKLGQVIARDRRIELELRTELSKLESLPPATSHCAIEETLQSELGDLQSLGLVLNPPALAEASVAVVVPFTNEAGTIDGVFKVLKPGVEQRLHEELSLLDRVASHLDQHCDRLGLPEIAYQETFAQVRDKISWELRLDQEQKHLSWAGKFYAGNCRVQIPKLLDDYCTPRVTAMERVYGRKVTEHEITDRNQTLRLAKLIAQALIAAPVFSRADTAAFHSDPHAGNLYLTDDGRLAILDWSLVGELGERQRQAITQVLLGGLLLRADRIVAALESVAERPPADLARLNSVVEKSLAGLSQNGLPGMSWLVDLLDRAATDGGLRVSGDMLLFRKSLLTLEGVLGDLGDVGYEENEVMLREFAKNFVAEWPLRWISLPASRDFATRLSNLDLSEAAASAPWALVRRLASATLDRLEQKLGATTITG